VGETYNIGGNNELTNNEIVKILISKLDIKLKRSKGESKNLIVYVQDRKGHDKRYAIDNSKIKKELGWVPKHSFNSGINKTIDWYLNNLN
jgi:dTDP-glucose 4,6-dehydratase